MSGSLFRIGAALAASAALVAAAAAPAPAYWPQRPYPPAAALEEAVDFALGRPGRVAFAIAEPDGRVRGHEPDAIFSSASASKALLLAAELSRLNSRGSGVDQATRALLAAMITLSDNDAADVIAARVGEAGLLEVAERSGMESFVPIPGYWGGAQVSAADLARFYIGLPADLPARSRRLGMHLLAAIVPEQRWGIPAAAEPSWRVWFKGGWRPPGQPEENSGPVTHQAGLLRARNGARVAIAVLTDQAPGSTTFETIEGITARLLTRPPVPGRWPSL